MTLTLVPVTDTPPQTAIDKAVEDARNSIVSTGSAIPRNPDGTFAARAGDQNAPPQGGQPAAPGEEVEAQPEGHPATPEAPAGQQTAEPAEPPAPEGEPEGQPPAKPLTVELLDRNGQAMELELGDEQTADMVRSYVNAAERGRVAESQLGEAQRAIEQYEAEREAMLANPLGFLRDNGITTDPTLREHLILSLVAEHWDAVRDRVVALDDPQELRTTRAETKTRQLELDGEIREALAEQRAVRTNLGEINGAIGAIMPDNLKPSQQRIFQEACLVEIKRYADHYNLLTVPVDQLPEILGDTLEAWDIDADTAAELLGHAAPQGRRPSAPVARPVARPVAPPAPRSPAPPRAAAPPPRPAPNGQRFVASARRKASAASPPPGAGSPGTSAILPPKATNGKPMGIADTIAWHRQNRGRLRPSAG